MIKVELVKKKTKLLRKTDLNHLSDLQKFKLVVNNRNQYSNIKAIRVLNQWKTIYCVWLIIEVA